MKLMAYLLTCTCCVFTEHQEDLFLYKLLFHYRQFVLIQTFSWYYFLRM